MAAKRESGLDIDLGNRCSRRAYSWAKKTFDTRDGRSGAVGRGADGGFANLARFGGAWVAVTSDGIGTKVELAERTGVYDTLGYDLVAMVVDDLVASGVEPTTLSNILDVDYLDEDTVDALMRGLHDAAREAGVAVVGGEIAELGSRIGGWGPGMHFNWCSTALGVLPEGLEPIDGRAVRAGDAVVALASRGFRSNGFSLLRRVLGERFGERWHEAPVGDGIPGTWGEAALTPCRIFCRAVTELIAGGLVPHAIAHITGGGIGDNLRRVLPADTLGAALGDLFEPPGPMRRLQEVGGVDEREAYTLWNMGNGMLLVVAPEDAAAAVEQMTAAGVPARVAGEVNESREITVQSRGARPARLVFG